MTNLSKRAFFSLFLCLIFLLPLLSCAREETPKEPDDLPAASVGQTNMEFEKEAKIDAFLPRLQAAENTVAFTREMLKMLLEEYDSFAIEILSKVLSRSAYGKTTLYELFGVTPRALSLLSAEETPDNVHLKHSEHEDLTLAFTGDVCLADDWYNMVFYNNHGYTPEIAFPGTLYEKLTGADLLLVNNEFCFSTRGEKIPGKQYLFRADPENVSILEYIGTDIACLANNHCYDYGKDAFLDTLSTLNDAGIPYVGAGKDLEEAMRPQYFVTGGRVIAYVAASRAEKTLLTPEAGEDSPGVLRVYESERFLSVIEEARENADYVIAYVHWGAENTHYLEPEIEVQAREFIDAGADAVVGSHAHRLQALDYYKGKPIFYNLGDFYFNLETQDTVLATLTLTDEGVKARVIPCVQSLAKLYEVSLTADGERILNFLRSLSPNVEIDEEGYFAKKAE